MKSYYVATFYNSVRILLDVFFFRLPRASIICQKFVGTFL